MNSANGLAQPVSKAGDFEQDAALLAFNRLPSRYLHRSWRAQFAAGNLSDFLFDDALSHKLLSDYLRQESGLDDVEAEASRHPAVRIGMQLDEHQLQALCRRIGVALIGQQIRLTIAGKEIASWIAALGEPLFRFACRYAPLLDGPSLVTVNRPTSLYPGTAAEQTATAGQQFLSESSLLINASIGQRLCFRLPREISHQTDMTINPTHYSEVWTWIDRVWNCMPMPVSPSPMRTMEAYR
jgi:hypothetical protein